MVTICLVVSVGGCRANRRARDEVYQQKLVRDVRVLEDRLYAADYENRVLIDRLKRRQTIETVDRSKVRIPSTIRNDQPSRMPKLSDGLEEEPRQSVFDPPVLEPPPETDEALADPPRPPREPVDELEGIDLDFDPGTPMMDSAEGIQTPTPDAGPKNFPLPAPPSEPIPPGPSDLKFDPIEPGEILPPETIDGGNGEPAGQITLPPGVGSAAPPAVPLSHLPKPLVSVQPAGWFPRAD